MKKKNWSMVPWTPFAPAHWDVTDSSAKDLAYGHEPHRLFLNSRYQVAAWDLRHPVFGDVVHLSFKTLDRQARHDWRDIQRIKNELCGPECDAIEIYPAESKLVDTANQYHLFVFETYKLDLGFQYRLVTEGSSRMPGGGPTRQRPWEPDNRPADVQTLNDVVEQHRKAPDGETPDR